MMKKNSKGGIGVFAPFFLALGSAYFDSMWLAAATIVLIFILVAVLPFCKGRENLWLFILCTICSIPINIFLLIKFPQWRYILYSGAEKNITYYISLMEIALIGTGVEEVIIALIGRRFWKRQYTLYIPEVDWEK